MLYSIKDREDLKKLEALDSLQNRVQEVRLQDKLGEQNYHYDLKRLIEPMAEIIKITSQDITKTITESSMTNNQAIENVNNNF